jgi:23S rRNA (uracil1939-C5)-methyltransferase
VKGKPQRVAELSIESLSMKRGDGSGSFLSKTEQQIWVDVPFTLPGEKVKASLIRKKGGVYNSRLEEVLTASPDRIPPKCTHFGTCGGCRWQHIPYPLQLNQKEAFVRHVFASLITSFVKIHPILPCDPPWNYRNKMEFSFSQDLKGERYLGLVMDASRGKVFHLKECHLVQSWIVQGLVAVREWWNESTLQAYQPFRDEGTLRTLTFREGVYSGDRMAILTVSGNPDYALKKHDLETFKAFVCDAIEPIQGGASLSLFLRIQQIAKGRPTQFYEMLLKGPDHIEELLQITYSPTKPPLSLKFNISPSAFFQPNTRQAERLYSTALQMACIPEGAIVYDLYCGTGTLGICTAKWAKQVIGIEISLESSLDARTNVKNNGLNNVTILTGAVAQVLADIRRENSYPMPDVVVIDPPRVGLESAGIKQIAELKPGKILYISCNPVTQASDAQALMQEGYRLTEICPVDQFPQTAHIENIIVLEKQ